MNLISHLGKAVLVCVISAAAAWPQSAWQAAKAGAADLVAVHFTSSSDGWIAGDNGYLARTTDGGGTWQKYELNTTEDINEIYFRNDDNGYLVAGRKMFLTRDGGRSWQETVLFRPGDFPNSTPEFLSIKFADRKLGLVIGSVLNRRGDVVDSLVMRTTDGGETWRRVIVPSRTELFHLDFVGGSKAWIVGDGGVILHTRDGGDTWSKQLSGTNRALYNVDFRDSSDGYVVGANGTILRTENGGDNWIKVNAGVSTTFLRVDFADDKNGWIVGHGGTILRSGDRGRTWTRQESGTRDSLYGLFVTKRVGIAVGSKGTLVRRIR